MKITRLIAGLILTAVLAVSVMAQQPNSCTSPEAGNLQPLIGNVSTKWNCWLMDYVYQFYRARSFSEYLSATYAGHAVDEDAIERLNLALAELRRSEPEYFDHVMADHGLHLQEK